MKKQHEWRCPVCKILHKGFTLDECRNENCSSDIKKGGEKNENCD